MALIIFDSKNQAGPIASGSPTLTHSIGSTSANMLLVLSIVSRTAGNPTHDKVTYNGVNMTKDKEQIEGTNIRGSIWSLVNPTTGNNTIQIYFSANNNYRAISSSYSGILQSSPLDVATASTGNTLNVSDSVNTSVANTVVIDALIHEDTSASTPGASQTSLFANDEGQWNTGDSYIILTSAGDATMAWTAGGGDLYDHVVVAYKSSTVTDTGSSNDLTSYMFFNT